MAIAGGSAGGAVAALNAAQAAASAADAAAAMSSVTDEGLTAFFAGQELRCLRIDCFYGDRATEKNHRDFMIFACIERTITVTERRGLFKRKEVSVTKTIEESVSMPKAIQQLLPATATVVSLAIDWHNNCVRAYYVLPKKT